MSKLLVWVTTPANWTTEQREILRDQILLAVEQGGVIVTEEGVTMDLTDLEHPG